MTLKTFWCVALFAHSSGTSPWIRKVRLQSPCVATVGPPLHITGWPWPIHSKIHCLTHLMRDSLEIRIRLRPPSGHFLIQVVAGLESCLLFGQPFAYELPPHAPIAANNSPMVGLLSVLWLRCLCVLGFCVSWRGASNFELIFHYPGSLPLCTATWWF